MAVIPIAAEKWETISPKRLADELSIAKGGIPAVMSAMGKLPVTYTFKTREGGMGVVQILEMQHNKKPRHFRIRYKMLQERTKIIATGGFSQAYDVVLYDIDHPATKGKICAINLANSKLLTVPRQQRMAGDAMMDWARRRGVDAVAEIAGKERGLIGVDLAVEMLASDEWDTITPQKLRALLTPTHTPRQDTRTMLFEEAPPQPIFAFRTREGIYGVLQILDVDKSTQKVKFR
jgi:hypothetical protein